ncbi:MAG: hypothetical protein JXR72_07225 [Proteobacteria bacterium]|nr:hypothetical protein [Pseudomonadota bacterium]
MTTENQGSDIQRLIEIVWRRKWVILFPFLVIFLAVAFWGLYLPNLYQSTASIIVEPQKVPAEYVRSTISTDLEDRLRTISQQMTSRTKLLKVIEELDLYPEMTAEKVPSEVLVARMRKDLAIEAPTARRGSPADFFQVSYLHPEPNKAMLAVSRLVSLFIEESLRGREQQAQGTTLFIEEELEKLRTVLEEQERAIQEYKSRYMGALPDQLDANLRMLDNLQLQLSDNQEAQRETEDRLMLLERERSRLEGEMRVAAGAVGEDGTVTGAGATLNELLLQQDELRRRVASLESMYTELHPDLITARKELARTEERIREVSESLGSAPAQAPSRGVAVPGSAASSELSALRRQMAEVRPRLSALRQEETDLKARIGQLQQRVEAAPQREQRLLQLTRDYENTKASYEDLLGKKLEATLSENLERRQQGENFQILDPANYPEKPFLPDRKKIIAMGFAGGIGSGLGLAFLLEMLFPAFYSLKQLKGREEFPIIIGIPYIKSVREKRSRGRRLILGTGAIVVAAVVALFLFNRYVAGLDQVLSAIGENLKGMM